MTINPGDSLWSVADKALTTAWGRRPPAGVLAHYWWQLLEANRDHLPDPGNPDLVFPGDTLLLPPLPQPPQAPS